MAVKISNNASSLLAGSITATDTGLSVGGDDAGKFPALAAGDWFPVTIIDPDGSMEIVKVTARSGAALTMVRGQEGTTARAFPIGSRCELRLTAAAATALVNDFVAAFADSLGDLASLDVAPVANGGTGAATAVGAADALATIGANIASAATTNLSAATGISVTVTGTTTITSFGNVSAGSLRIVTFAGALTLTHHATNLVLPGAANIVTAAGDVALMLSLGSSRWKCIGYTKSGGPFSGPATFTSNPVIQNSTPFLRFSDTDAGTYDAQWVLNNNNIYLQGSPNGSTYATKIQFELDTNNVYFGTSSSLALVWNGTAVPLNVGGTGATNAAAARTNLGLGGLATMNLNDLNYTGTAVANTVFPVTETVLVYDSGAGSLDRNASATVRLGSSYNTDTGYRLTGSGAALTGTWRNRGQGYGDQPLFLMRRTA